MHEALAALQRVRDRSLFGMGYDRARDMGVLGSYMEMLNRGGSGGYSRRQIMQARVSPGVDRLTKISRRAVV